LLSHEEFKRRIKTQTVLPSADTAAMLFWALLASGQINMRKVDGWQTLATKPVDQPIDLAAETIPSCSRKNAPSEFQPLSGRHHRGHRGSGVGRQRRAFGFAALTDTVGDMTDSGDN
jgi:hypothetical protein